MSPKKKAYKTFSVHISKRQYHFYMRCLVLAFSVTAGFLIVKILHEGWWIALVSGKTLEILGEAGAEFMVEA